MDAGLGVFAFPAAIVVGEIWDQNEPWLDKSARALDPVYSLLHHWIIGLAMIPIGLAMRLNTFWGATIFFAGLGLLIHDIWAHVALKRPYQVPGGWA